MKLRPALLAFLALAIFATGLGRAWAAPPVVSNVRASQRAGTALVDIYYDLADPDSSALTVSMVVSKTGGTIYLVPATSFTGALGAGIAPGSNKKITWNAGVDMPAALFSNVRVSVTASEEPVPSGMTLIPAGSFTMGNSFGFNADEGDPDELPLHSVYVSAFYMDRTEVTKALWDDVYNWAITHGYSFDFTNRWQGKPANHPAQLMTWHDAVKWCNARSEQEGRVPAYYTDAELSERYRSGQVEPTVNWSSGYRLPTEAEWEKAARGGADGRRFPWTDEDIITHSRANYNSTTNCYNGDYNCDYDVSPTRGSHPTFKMSYPPYTSSVGNFSPNGYGLYDMAGNVFEWCWDWYSSTYYSSSPASDPRGPTSGSIRVNRGGSWLNFAAFSRTAYRNGGNPLIRGDYIGFRSVLPPGQP